MLTRLAKRLYDFATKPACPDSYQEFPAVVLDCAIVRGASPLAIGMIEAIADQVQTLRPAQSHFFSMMELDVFAYRIDANTIDHTIAYLDFRRHADPDRFSIYADPANHFSLSDPDTIYDASNFLITATSIKLGHAQRR